MYRKVAFGKKERKSAALWYTTLSFIKKAELMQDLPIEAQKALIYSQLNILGGDFFSLKL